MNDLYRSFGLVACFEGEGGGEGGSGDAGAGDGQAGSGAAGAAGAAGAGGPGSPSGQGGSPSAGGDDKGGKGKNLFTQDDVNRFLAEDKRKHQTALAQMEAKLQEALADKSMTEATRKALEENLAAVQGQMRTKEQQLAHEKKQLKDAHRNELTELKKKLVFWEGLYRESTIDRALQDAAVKNDAFNPSQVVVLLRSDTKLLEEVDEKTGTTTGKYRTVVSMQGVDPKTGEQVTLSCTPEEAVKRMKELPDVYGNLFKSGVVSGIGAGTATGGTPGKGGKIDVTKLTPAQYRKIRAENPELLGLRPNQPK